MEMNLPSAYPRDQKQRWSSLKFTLESCGCQSRQVKPKEHSVDLIKLHYEALFV